MMILFRTSVLASGAIAAPLVGCAPMIPGLPGSQPPRQAELTPEQSHRLTEALLRRLEQSPAPMQAAAAHTKTTATNPITEAELARQLAAFPALSAGVVIEGRRDGFAVDGIRYIDPEGAIVRYGADPSSGGDVTYMAQTDQDSFVLKTVRVAGGQAPVTIATAMRRNGLWHVETVTGKNHARFAPDSALARRARRTR